MDAGAISLMGVSKGFGEGGGRLSVIEDFNLEVAAGETVAICGPSGVGKSTLLNLIAGLIPVDGGSLNLRHAGRSHPLHRLPEARRTSLRRRLIGYVFQFFNLVPTLTLLENVALPLHLNNLQEHLPRVRRQLLDLGLGARLQVFPDTLSGGEQQRAAIARALAHEPPILLADEPTGNLDARSSRQVAELLFGEARRLGCALVIATHSMELASQADRRIDLGA